LKRLNRELIAHNNLPAFVDRFDQENLPEKVVQFGEGNFLRGFVDWMIQQVNKQGLFNGRIVAIQPTPHGKVVPKLNEQDGLYTFLLQGIEDGEKIEKYEVVSSISRGINPYENWDEVLTLAESETIEFVFSNTTEAGLTYTKETYSPNVSPLSFPGKLAAFLHHRFRNQNGNPAAGLTMIPCELVEGNGDLLKEIILKISDDWGFDEDFKAWVKKHNHFCNTLVDRIVPGYPKDNIERYQEKLGYKDQLFGVGEPYHLFAIEADSTVSKSLPFEQAGLNVKWGDVTPYRDLKVSILNAPHTMMFSVGYSAGLNTVYEVMEDSQLFQFVQTAIEQEILPVVPFDEREKRQFANSVIERFKNPFVKHSLNDLGLNAFSKFKTRVLPLLSIWIDEKQEIPPFMSFSLAALLAYYRPKTIINEEQMIGTRGVEEYSIRDSKEAIRVMSEGWDMYNNKKQTIEQLVQTVLRQEVLWGRDLSKIEGFTQKVSSDLEEIVHSGVRNTLNKVAWKVV